MARHAGAEEVRVRLFRAGEEIVLQIRDDGRGAREEEMESAEALGILGMRERTAAHGGSLEIRGEAGRGTVLEARIPLDFPTMPGGGEG